MRRLGVILAVAALAAPAAAHASANPQIAGLQVALRAHGLYLAQIDGIAGPRTSAAVHAFQRRHHLRVGVADLRTRAALGPLGRPLFGSRTLRQGDFGWDVSVLQFLLVRRGVYNGALDGYMGKETGAALRRYQRAMHLHADAVVGPRTLTAIVRHDRVPVRAASRARPERRRRATSCTGRLPDRDRARTRNVGRRARGLNHLDPAKPILIGQKLRLPAGAPHSLGAQSVDVRSILDAWATRLGVDHHLVRALAWMESGYQTSIVSPAGASACCRRCRRRATTSRRFSTGKRFRARWNGDVEVGVLYLKHLLAVVQR